MMDIVQKINNYINIPVPQTLYRICFSFPRFLHMNPWTVFQNKMQQLTVHFTVHIKQPTPVAEPEGSVPLKPKSDIDQDLPSILTACFSQIHCKVTSRLFLALPRNQFPASFHIKMLYTIFSPLFELYYRSIVTMFSQYNVGCIILEVPLSSSLLRNNFLIVVIFIGSRALCAS
jgi:hypothetical protein